MVNDMMKQLIDSLMGRKRVLIDENERAVWLYKGEVRGILGAGEHVLKNRDGSLRIERQALTQMLFKSAYEQAVLEKLPVDAATHLTVVRTAENEIAVDLRDLMLGRHRLAALRDARHQAHALSEDHARQAPGKHPAHCAMAPDFAVATDGELQ